MPSFFTARPPSRPSPRRRALLVLCGLLVLTGCSTVDRDWDVPLGPGFRPDNYTVSGPIPSDVRRLAILPLASDDWEERDLASLQSAFQAELGKFERFELVPVSRAELNDRFGHRSFESTEALPGDLLSRLRADFGADAVLFLDLTHYSPYQPIAIGIRAKLVGATPEAPVWWSFDAVFDSAQPEVSTAARRYYLEESRPPYPLENTSGILQSPARFAKYVAHEVFATMPSPQAGEYTLAR